MVKKGGVPIREDTENAIRLLMRSGRVEHTNSGEFRVRYTAVDPADNYVRCSCGRPDCWTRDLRPLREHIKALVHAIFSCGTACLIDGGNNPWPGTSYSLQMAASIEDVFVDPSYTDDSESALWCRPAWEFDEEQREHSSKYVAAVTIFNFTWIAYETAIESTLGASYSSDKPPVQARKFLKSAQLAERIEIPHFSRSYGVATKICLNIRDIEGEIKSIGDKYNLEGFAAAAELARIFRNHIVHGRDSTPLSGGGYMVSHLYAVTRLLLLLIQVLVFLTLKDRKQMIALNPIDEVSSEYRADFLIKNLHRQEKDSIIENNPLASFQI